MIFMCSSSFITISKWFRRSCQIALPSFQVWFGERHRCFKNKRWLCNMCSRSCFRSLLSGMYSPWSVFKIGRTYFHWQQINIYLDLKHVNKMDCYHRNRYNKIISTICTLMPVVRKSNTAVNQKLLCFLFKGAFTT